MNFPTLVPYLALAGCLLVVAGIAAAGCNAIQRTVKAEGLVSGVEDTLWAYSTPLLLAGIAVYFLVSGVIASMGG